ncbi:hypothetical protein AL035_02055 [Salipiger aestuarii]|nr:hypothetical protein AL035_02055 [Salipiger aestuarii]
MRYRIRKARIEVCDGSHCWHTRRFIAERRINLFGFIPIWWAVIDARWRCTPADARVDVDRDAKLRAPLSDPEFITTAGRP